jgi:hypothetical protein
MNSNLQKQVVFALILAVAFIISACGTIEIGVEPDASVAEPTDTVTEVSQPEQIIEQMESTTAAVADSDETVASEAAAEEMAEPLATVGYSSEETGISFSYPTSWAMEEGDKAFIFRRGAITLRVRYKMPGQAEWGEGRTGMGGTGVSALEGTTQFLDKSLAKFGVFYEDLLIIVVYGGEPGTKVQSGAMEFTIVLEDPNTDYKTLTITDEVLSEAEMILSSFTVGSTQGGPTEGLQTYINHEYGFALNYLSTWTVAAVNDVDFVGPGSRSVQLSQGSVTLIIGYRRAGETVAMGGSGAPGGEFEIRGTVHVAGQDVDRHVIVYEGKDKVVMYGQPGLPSLSAGGLEFALRMDDFAQVNYEEIELSQTVQDEADMILSSLALLESDSVTSDQSSENDSAGWQTYTNDVWGYSLMVPAGANIVSPDPSQRVAFVGPEINNKPKFQFMVEHYEISPPEGTEFYQTLIESHRAFLDSLGINDEGMIEEVAVAGFPAIRLRHPGTSEVDPPRDDFFFMRGNTVFTISIVHFGGAEDEVLNDQLLQSISFEPE